MASGYEILDPRSTAETSELLLILNSKSIHTLGGQCLIVIDFKPWSAVEWVMIARVGQKKAS